MWSGGARDSGTPGVSGAGGGGKRTPRGREAARPRRRWSRLSQVIAVVGGLLAASGIAFVLLGGDEKPQPRALTSDEVNRLSVTRFLNYQAGGRAVTLTVPGVSGGLVVTASVDYRTHTGYGVVRGTGREASSNGLIRWTATDVAVRPMPDPPALAPASPPAAGWHSRPLQTSGMSLDSALAILLDLGSDRPDNSALLSQNGAAWIGREEVRGHRTDVMNGPRAEADTGGGAGSGGRGVRYWVGGDGTMYRVEIDLASASEPVVLDFDTHDHIRVPALPDAAPGPRRPS
ncbi:hypothetical protein AB0D49_33660 [Streptomyces sp. NPDC048290]|uniref:hypothetical protein n=1 Tax=Streptomyces sp. NPDC048290 TaxID=3155811 RepID=UPI0034467975